MREVRVKRPDTPRSDSVKFLPGNATTTGWLVPEDITRDEWVRCGKRLTIVEGAIQWWLGDWWAFGGNREWGDGRKIAEEIGVEYSTVTSYASVSKAFDFSNRLEKVSFTHHFRAMAADPSRRLSWLKLAQDNDWSTGKLKSEIAREAAIGRTTAIEFNAAALGKFAVLYADPPWRYENPPMGGGNRSIENHYPTMELEQICALPVGDIAHDDSVLYMWATVPKLAECMQVLDAWGFLYRTCAAWDKVDIGMGYYFRNQHELLLVGKRGELPPPTAGTQPSSLYSEKVGEHSAKPLHYYDMLDDMYPGIRKIELFGRAPEDRALWSTWGNQAAKQEAAA
jgi:N6-adenosine-specific RNA methylase IME4